VALKPCVMLKRSFCRNFQNKNKLIMIFGLKQPNSQTFTAILLKHFQQSRLKNRSQLLMVMRSTRLLPILLKMLTVMEIIFQSLQVKRFSTGLHMRLIGF